MHDALGWHILDLGERLNTDFRNSIRVYRRGYSA